jgi:hypothetical protein
MLSGKEDPDCFPFPADSMVELKRKVMSGEYKPLKNLSRECQNLLALMINVDPWKRIKLD